MLYGRNGEGEEGKYQFAAMMGFPRGLTRLDLGLSFILGIEERFFFFWSSRPMLRDGEWVVEGVVLVV